jgi:hypothetical protein
LNHASQAEANSLFSLFRTWLRKQFTLLGCKADADELAMHLLARSQGVATLANAFQDEKFIKKEIKLMCEWLSSCVESAALNAGDGGGSNLLFSMNIKTELYFVDHQTNNGIMHIIYLRKANGSSSQPINPRSQI